jgi:2-furoyl-CoA dehydrogenase large subunit
MPRAATSSAAAFSITRCQTAATIPEVEILHLESPSPVTPLGAKGMAEGNSMSTPGCIAKTVADALGVAEITR